MRPINCFIGYDPKEAVAYQVLSHTLLANASVPISITPLVQAPLRKACIYTRVRGETESTEFSMTRFLVPYLSNYEGWSIFMDCDMVCQADISEALLYALAYPDKPVHVCQHYYQPKTTRKFLGQPQTKYARKNWSSFIIFNNELCKALTPDLINTASGLDLHRFAWVDHDDIGSLPLEWNWLVGEYERNPDAKVYHYTLGTPCFEGYQDCDHADVWWNAYAQLSHPLTTSITEQPNG